MFVSGKSHIIQSTVKDGLQEEQTAMRKLLTIGAAVAAAFVTMPALAGDCVTHWDFGSDPQVEIELMGRNDSGVHGKAQQAAEGHDNQHPSRQTGK